MDNEISRLYDDDSLPLRTLARRQNAMSVSHFITPPCEMQLLYRAAMWRLSEHERQLVLKIAPPKIYKAQKRGTKMHQKQQEETMGPLPAPLVHATPIQDYGKKLFDLAQCLILLSRGVSVKEIPVFGTIDGILLSGVVDEVSALETDGGIEIRLSELKTTKDASNVIGSYKHVVATGQLSVYHQLLQQMLESPKSFKERIAQRRFASRKDLPLEIKLIPFKVSKKVIPEFFEHYSFESLSDLYRFVGVALDELLKASPKIARDMSLTFTQFNYSKREDLVEYFSATRLGNMVQMRKELFDQEREPIPYVPGYSEIRICNYCEFKPICALKKREDQATKADSAKNYQVEASAT